MAESQENGGPQGADENWTLEQPKCSRRIYH